MENENDHRDFVWASPSWDYKKSHQQTFRHSFLLGFALVVVLVYTAALELSYRPPEPLYPHSTSFTIMSALCFKVSKFQLPQKKTTTCVCINISWASQKVGVFIYPSRISTLVSWVISLLLNMLRYDVCFCNKNVGCIIKSDPSWMSQVVLEFTCLTSFDLFPRFVYNQF